MKRLYIIVRQDLHAGLQLAQACHALQAMNDQHPAVVASWEGNIVVLGARDQQHLSELFCELQRAKIPVATFCEPDEGGELTAMAAHGDASRKLSHLPLALRKELFMIPGVESSVA